MKIYIYLFSLLILGCSQEEVTVTMHEQIPLDIKKSCSIIKKGMNLDDLNSIMKGHGLMKAENFFSRNNKKHHIYYWNVPMGNPKEINTLLPNGNTCLVWFNDQNKVDEITFENIIKDAS